MSSTFQSASVKLNLFVCMCVCKSPSLCCVLHVCDTRISAELCVHDHAYVPISVYTCDKHVHAWGRSGPTPNLHINCPDLNKALI